MSEQKSGRVPEQDAEIPVLNERQRQELLRLARRAITKTVSNETVEPERIDDQQLQENAAVFVTLWQLGPTKSEPEGGRSLRGCIGRLQPDSPLDQAVEHAAISAATHDPRFLPVRFDEIENLMIEIAILSPLEEVNGLEDVVIGRDGLVIEAMGRRGLLLPKVATRLNWDREEFLRNVCIKAGLPEDTWPENGRLYKFNTTEFHD